MFEVFGGVDDADGFGAAEDSGEVTVGAGAVFDVEGEADYTIKKELEGADNLVQGRCGGVVFSLENGKEALDVVDSGSFQGCRRDEGVEAFGYGGVTAGGLCRVFVSRKDVAESYRHGFGK